jgi:ferredoxin
MVYIKSNCDPTACSTDPVKPCQLACPFKTDGLPPLGMPRYQLNDGGLLPDGRANKCDFCYDRRGNSMLKGNNDPFPPPAFAPLYGARYKGTFAKSHKKTACELTCPPGAIKTGKAKKIWLKARRRRKKLMNKLGYPNANIYPGLHTHVIWILLECPECYGLPLVGP